MTVWNGWYHINGNTYGTWLRGDPRGWRARHHREHVEGDYKTPPPPGTYERLKAHSRRLMKRDPVHLSLDARKLACRAMLDSLRRNQVEVIALSVDEHHFHLLARFRKRACPAATRRRKSGTDLAVARHCIGIAKKDIARILAQVGLVRPGGVWATCCRCLPIKDRKHQVNVARYIADHARRGAAVWTCWKHDTPDA